MDGNGLKSAVAYAMSFVTASVGLVSPDEVSKWVFLGIGILSAIISFALNLWDLVKKVKSAKADGIVTEEEREAIEKEAREMLEELKKELEEAQDHGEVH